MEKLDGRHEKLEEPGVVGINAGAGKGHSGENTQMTLNGKVSQIKTL